MAASELSDAHSGGSPGTALYTGVVALKADLLGAALAITTRFFGESDYAGRVQYDAQHAAEHLASFVPDANRRGWIAVLEGQPVGYLLAELSRPWFSDTKVAYEMGMYLLPIARERGLGKTLLGHLEAWARICGARYVQVSTTSGIDTYRVGLFFRDQGYDPGGSVFTKEL